MNHYPAIDILASISRVLKQVSDERQRKLVAQWRTILSKYQDVELLIRIRNSKHGADKQIDAAIDSIKAVNGLLPQGLHDDDDFKTRVHQTCPSVGYVMAKYIGEDIFRARNFRQDIAEKFNQEAAFVCGSGRKCETYDEGSQRF
jgi:F0F1-type ATP synthase alpha subunit